MSESQDEAMVRSITRECEQCAVGVIPFVPLDRVRWLLAKVGELKAKNSELQMLVKHDVAVEPYEREKIAVLEGELCAVVEQAAALRSEFARLRAENERLYAGNAALEAERQRLMGRVEYEMNENRATALTASEAEAILSHWHFPIRLDPLSAKLQRIAHPEPQEGSQ